MGEVGENKQSVSSPWAIELLGLSKSFGPVLANDQIYLQIKKGSIHGIIGENGAGKSTAMKMLYGVYTPDQGDILVNGEKKIWRTPADAIDNGIGMVHQHFMLAAPYTALDNIILGKEPMGLSLPWAKIQRNKAKVKLQALMERYHMPIDLDAPIESLAVGLQQRIEILKLLYREAEILILDEPTAVLTPQEIQALFQNLKVLRSQGKTIIIITHKLKEVMELTDRITVFRQGRVSGEINTSETNEQKLADLMVGRKVLLSVEKKSTTALSEKVVLKLQNVTLAGNVSSRPLLENLNLELKEGEIVGIAGVEGNGQTELLHLLSSPKDYPLCHGKVFFEDKDISKYNTSQVRSLGVGIIPADRHKEGLLLDRALWENFMLGHTQHYTSKGCLNHKDIFQDTQKAIDEFDVRPPNKELTARGLSGGNQQKLILAREFFHHPRLMLIAQPTRGVDVGSIEFIHREILKAKDQGKAILLISSELEEVMGLSDRLIVMYEGKFVAEFAYGKTTEQELGLYMGGGKHV